jgi:hypothetical protein
MLAHEVKWLWNLVSLSLLMSSVQSFDFNSTTLCSTVDMDNADSSGCLTQEIRQAKLRVAFVDKQYCSFNQPAMDKTKNLGMKYVYGKTCDSESAPEEWLVGTSAFEIGAVHAEIYFVPAVLLRRIGNTDGWESSCGTSYSTD